ncbi:MAG: preprotein translocase subunit SecE [Chthonomonadales bacterium]|nr:preprotein translocase subunit SecE [Chthonomonadales bacterium]
MASDEKPAGITRGRSFIHEVIVELKKTTWPTPKEAWRLTVVVLMVVVFVAVYVGVIDVVLTKVTKSLNLIK